MKKIFIVLFFNGIVLLFSNELDIAKQYVDNNALLTGYNILDLNFNKDSTKTFLFYNPYNNRILTLDDSPLAFTDAVIIKANSEYVIQYLIITRNGFVQTNDNITFYDFSEIGYSSIKFNGWLLRFGGMEFDGTDINTFAIQLTNDGIDVIAADPPLPEILWDYKFNHPVKYKYRMHPLPSPAWLLEYEWNEDIDISCARTGLRDTQRPGLLDYLDNKSSDEKRLIINVMFALHGYEFKTDEWKTYFSKFLWYKPDESVINSPEILDEYQKKMYEYLTK